MAEQFPTLTTGQAAQRLEELRADPTFPCHVRRDPDAIENEYARRLALACDNLRGSLRHLGPAQHFDRRAARIIHEYAPTLPTLMQGDPGFWRWFSIEHGSDVVEHRYGGSTQAGRSHYGVGSTPWDCLFMRLWFRADISFDPDEPDPYRRSELGDVDFWESGILRNRYSSARNLVKAFVDYAYDDPADPTRDRWQRATGDLNRNNAIRIIYKNLNRLHATVAYETLSLEQCTEILHKLSENLPRGSS